jgi:hypothetical protein
MPQRKPLHQSFFFNKTLVTHVILDSGSEVIFPEEKRWFQIGRRIWFSAFNNSKSFYLKKLNILDLIDFKWAYVEKSLAVESPQ